VSKVDDSKEKNFNKYLLSEYENIAEAHFRTIGAISAFFRYYLLIAAFPMTLLGVLIGFSLSLSLRRILSTFGLLFSTIFFLVAIVGLFVLLYVISLRMDAILYSRTVNGIRKYFYDNAKGIDIETKLRIRVLPQSPYLPRYSEGRYFLPVVLTFASMDSFYVLLASYISISITVAGIGSTTLNYVSLSLISYPVAAFFIFFALHVGLYYWYARFREHEYLQSHAVGVDIDGVLNDHRTQFCKLFALLTGKTIDPEKISRIPVHEDSSLNVSRPEEHAVFDVPAYYAEMPSVPEAADNLARIRNAFNLKIHIFTYRPRPSFGKQDPRFKEWTTTARKMFKDEPYPPVRRIAKVMLFNNLHHALNEVRLYLPWRFGSKPIDVITRCWLTKYHFAYDRLMIEQGSDTVSDPKGKIRNRFYMASKQKFRFFIEDDPEKAAKLAYVCDVVFLIKQPYNLTQKMPENVVRVDTWEDLYQNVRKLL
jgi:uncharacterized HAD superfamily protein